jgi:hypothetical protein
VYRAYIDESGHEGKNWVFLGGFLGSEEQWTEFVPKWEKGLGPQRPFLHMNRLRWKKESTRQLLERLGPIPDECGLIPVVGGVKRQDYEDLVSGTPEAKLLKGYVACIPPMVIQILRYIPKDERLELVFEDQHEYQPFAHLALKMGVLHATINQSWAVTTDGRPKLAKWRFVPKGSTIRLDPADYFAFALREAYTNPNSKKRKWCAPVLRSGKGEGVGVIMKREMIRRIVINTQMMTIYQIMAQRLAALC